MTLNISSGSGNGSGIYNEIFGVDDIVAGFSGNNSKDPEEIGNFLIGWSEWLAELINMVKDFFENIKTAINNKNA